jgi:hypothetical protein
VTYGTIGTDHWDSLSIPLVDHWDRQGALYRPLSQWSRWCRRMRYEPRKFVPKVFEIRNRED